MVNEPSIFKINGLEKGNYDVEITLLEDATEVSVNRRHIYVSDEPKEIITFTVNLIDNEHTFRVDSGPAELAPGFAVKKFDIRKAAADTVTMYIAGDSTVSNQTKACFGAWGHSLQAFFKRGAAVANHAYSGRSTRSFLAEGRLKPITDTIKPHDYLFIQFGHNDQKNDDRYTAPYGEYTDNLRLFINAARGAGAVPVLVTSVHRRVFDEHGKIVNTLGEYPDAVRKLAADEGVALIDLHEKSGELFEKLGAEASKDIFLHLSENNPYSVAAVADDTHFSAYGGLEMAKLVAEGIREKLPELAGLLR
jgi:lysophospholipase L1-like esterase